MIPEVEERMVDWMIYGKIQEYKRKGFNKSQVKRKIGKDYKTVLKYWDMTTDEYAAEKENALSRTRKPEPYEEYVVECLSKYPDMSAAQLYDWILEKRDGRRLSFKERAFRYYLANIREQYDIKKPIKIRQYEATDDPPMGEQSQVDMGEIILETDTGRHKKIYCFGMVMSHSRDKFVWWQERPFTTESFIACHIKAFTFFGGRTRQIVYDQDKVLAVSENNGDIIYTEAFQSFVNNVKFVIFLCRGNDPESKGRIENVVKYAKHGFAEHRIFHNIDSFNEDCVKWLERTGNGKVHETTKKIPAEVFSIEKQYLIPVSELKFNYTVNENISYPVRKDNIILYKSNRYRVPKGTYEPGKKVYMLVVDEMISVTDVQTREIYTRHPLCHEKGQLVGQKREERDKSQSLKKLEENILNLMGGAIAQEFLEKIHKEKPRYYRDQMGVLKNICEEQTDGNAIKNALNYCMERDLYSAGDFKSAIIYLNELNNTAPPGDKPKSMTGFPEKYRGMNPQVRDLGIYEKAMEGSVTN
jgi:transposase